MKSMIVAVDKNMGIGSNNDLLWGRDLPSDLAYFKRMTKNTSVIMGRKTYESMGRPLPDRENIVVSSHPAGDKGILTAVDLKSAYELARYPIFVIGGGQIYAASLKDMDVLYVTEVDAEFSNASIFFPSIDKNVWKEVSRERHPADEKNKYAFDFVVYERA